MADVIAYNGNDKWKQRATELLNEGGGGTEVDPTVPSWAKDPDGMVPVTLQEINDMFKNW